VKEKFIELFPQLHPGSKYKNPEKIVAILTYMVLKLENITIKRSDIVNTSTLSKEEFNTFILQIQRFIPEYTKRNRQDYVAQKILEITEHFGLDMPFYFLSRKILSKLWESIKNTADDVIAGLCASITTLCRYKKIINVSSICNLLDIKMSTIQFQVKNRIFERFGLPGFVSLVRSSGLLKGLMVTVGILEGERLEVEVIPEDSDDSGGNIVSIKLGNDKLIFNPCNDNYLIGCVDHNNSITLCYLEAHNHHNHRDGCSTENVRKNKGMWCDLTSSEYYPSKGPPMVNLT